MIITADHPESAKYMIYDCAGRKIPYVYSFDTETQEIELSIRIIPNESDNNQVCILMTEVPKDDGTVDYKPMIIKFKLPGAYLTKDGVLI